MEYKPLECAKEAAATRKVIERIPEGSNYRPDPRSRTAREIAWLITREETAARRWSEKRQLEWVEVLAPASIHDNAWGFLLDTIHHRGQRTTYLRPMSAKVSQICGPSADDPM